jgi:hypothetical protein
VTAEENCNSCPPGTASSTLGADKYSFCVACGVGTFSQSASVNCQNCSSGKFQDEYGQALCVRYLKSAIISNGI